jgi:NADPH:quinone reductase-like Zn-dependent oxidoreductase
MKATTQSGGGREARGRDEESGHAPRAPAAGGQLMRAIVQDRYGTAAGDVLRLARIGVPAVKDGEVLVRVRAAGVDRGTWHLMAGVPYLMRILGFGVRGPRAAVLGRDLAGTVEAVGRDVTGLEPGDEVFGTGHGSFAEYAPARPDTLTPKPANIYFEQAAAVPTSAITALQALRDRARLTPGQHVLIAGASGGVGTFAVQIAKAYGAEVTGVCSTAKMDLVRAIGADHVIDYTREDFADGRRRYDAVIDIGGNRRLAHLRRALTPRGTLVITGGEGGGRWLGGIGRNLQAALVSPFVSQRLTAFIARPRRADLVTLRDLMESGAVTPAIDRAYPLGEAAAAVGYLAEGKARGKVVLTI